MGSASVKQYDFTLEEVTKLFQMQDTLNSYIHPEWKTQGFNWGLAIVDECMEIHGHLGWKWWKKGYQVGLTEENRGQIQLEVIDILHFVVSQWAESDTTEAPRVFTRFINGVALEGNTDLGKQVSTLSRLVMTRQGEPFLLWALIAQNVGLTKNQILETYTQKYVLNKFRQDHGYKDGTYVKEWKVSMGVCDDQWLLREDNYWLEEVVSILKQGNHSTIDENLLYSELETLYYGRINQ